MPALRRHKTTATAVRPILPEVPPGITPDISAAERSAMISQAAYFLAEQRNFSPGHEVDDWLAAEGEVDAALGRTEAAAPGH